MKNSPLERVSLKNTLLLRHRLGIVQLLLCQGFRLWVISGSCFRNTERWAMVMFDHQGIVVVPMIWGGHWSKYWYFLSKPPFSLRPLNHNQTSLFTGSIAINDSTTRRKSELNWWVLRSTGSSSTSSFFFCPLNPSSSSSSDSSSSSFTGASILYLSRMFDLEKREKSDLESDSGPFWPDHLPLLVLCLVFEPPVFLSLFDRLLPGF